jgi:multiple sugar transport system ATP-binding protein
MNLVHTTVADRRVLFAGHSLTLPEGSGLEHLDSVIVGIRPHDFHLAGASRGGDAATMTARPDVIESLGTEVRIVFRVDAPSGAEPVATGSAKSAEADVTLLRDRGATGGPEMTFTACLREHVQLEAGRDVDLSIDPQALHFFDPRTGLAIGPRARADTTLDG